MGICMLDDKRHTIVIDNLTCLRDDLTECCPTAEVPEPKVVQGTLSKDSTGWYHLAAAAVCDEVH
jgi:hypothetical protein